MGTIILGIFRTNRFAISPARNATRSGWTGAGLRADNPARAPPRETPMAANPDESKARPLGFVQAGEVDMNAVQAKQMVLIDQMIAYQLANPGKPWTACAAALGVSTLWCRMMASSDAYKARYAQVSDKVITDVGLFGLKEKIAAAAELAVERMAEKIAVSESLGDLRDATELLLEHQFGGKGPGTPAPAVVNIQQSLILQGRDQICAPKEPVAEVIPLESKGD